VPKKWVDERLKQVRLSEGFLYFQIHTEYQVLWYGDLALVLRMQPKAHQKNPMKPSNVVTLYVLTLVTVMCAAPTARADEIVWGINASTSGATPATSIPPQINEIDVTTGSVLANFTAPNADAATANGRGLAYNNATSTIYYGFITTNGGLADDGKIYKTNAAGQDLGVLFDTHLAGISTITFDGTNLWVTDASPIPLLDNNIYEYSLSGTLLSTNSGLGSLRDGVTLANGYFVANQGQGKGPYDKYQLVGSTLTKVQSAFLDPLAHCPSLVNCGDTTGVTFDGTHYFVSNPAGYGAGTQGIMEFDINGNFVTEVEMPNPGPQQSSLLGTRPCVIGSTDPKYATCGWLLENLAAVTTGTTAPVPEPASVMLLGTVVLGLSMLLRRRSFRGQ
jgi:hypothetical protein